MGLDEFSSDNRGKEKRKRKFKNMDLETLIEFVRDNDVIVVGVGSHGISKDVFIKFASKYGNCLFKGYKRYEGGELESVTISGIKYQGEYKKNIAFDFMATFDTSNILQYREEVDGVEMVELRADYDWEVEKQSKLSK